jgi:cytochrome bd ubiquinol oxidase subunit II
MADVYFWPTLLYGMLVFIMAGYTLLDGFDLGVGMLCVFFPQSADKRLLLNALAPVWDGNEVWLIMAGGLLFAAFPPVYAAALTGFYLWMMAVLFALILRAASFEFWYQDEKRRGVWGAVFAGSSLAIALLLGLLVGNLFAGVPLSGEGQDTGVWPAQLRPLPWGVALAGVVLFFFQGAAFAAEKTEGALQARVLALAGRGWWGVLLAGLGLALLVVGYLPGAGGRALFWIGLGLTAVSLGLTGMALLGGSSRGLLAKSSLGLAGWWLLLGGVQFPYLIRALDPAAPGLTVLNASSPVPVLRLLAGFVAGGLLMVLGTTWFVYRVFKGKTKSEDAY